MSGSLSLPFGKPAPRQAPAPARTAVTVTELTHQIRTLLESTHAEVWVEGEIANSRLWKTGHLYFTLRDEHAQLKAVMFRSAIRYLQFTPEAVHHHLCCVLILTLLVGPFAGLELPLQVNFRPFVQEAFGDTNQVLVENRDAVPLGPFLHFAGILILPTFAGRDAQVGNFHTILCRADFGITPQISDNNDFIYAARHIPYLSFLEFISRRPGC